MDAGVVAPLEGVVAPLPPDGVVEPLGVVPELLVDELLELVVAWKLLAATGWWGTVNWGAPTVSAVEPPPPPQAARPTPRAAAITVASRNLVGVRRART